MPTNRVTVRRFRRSLSHEQEMSLWLGDHPYRPAFGGEQERRAAWVRHRDRLMAAWAKHGKRPVGWWDYEAPLPRPDSEREQSTLYEAGLLGETERAELLAEWRREFERAHGPHLFHCDGPGAVFHGAAARRRHYAWAGIPRALLAQWTRERRRRNRIIPRPKATTELPAT
jgi:hypothetical protein